MIFSKNNKITILLTGTINPNSFATLALKDPEIRASHYIESINFYLTNTNFKIVFSENSGNSLKDHFKNFEDRLEFLTYKSEISIPDKGKGAKELEIINYSINNSDFISKSMFVFKITGRLKVLNVNKLTFGFFRSKSTVNSLIGCNLYTENKMDSRCFLFTVDFFTFLLENGKNIDLKYSFERALYDSVVDYSVYNNGIFKQFYLPLRIKGISGGFGTAYDHSFITMKIKEIKHFFIKPFIYKKLRNTKR